MNSSVIRLWPAVLAMGLVVLVSNILVQYPLNDWLTYGAFTYPICFLVTELTNRRCGPQSARQVAWFGFALAVLLSLWLADTRIALASGTAFICSQLLDIHLFNRLRLATWWKAPIFASLSASLIDTLLFFSIAFVGSDVPWVTLALGDFAAKWAMDIVLLAPFRAFILLRPSTNWA